MIRLWLYHKKSQAKTLDCSQVQCPVHAEADIGCPTLSLILYHPLPLRLGLSLNLELISSARMPSQLAPDIFLFPPLPPTLWLQACVVHKACLFFVRVPVLEPGSSLRAVCAVVFCHMFLQSSDCDRQGNSGPGLL